MVERSMTRRRAAGSMALALTAACVASMAPQSVLAQPVVRLMVGYPAGGPVDGAARLIAPTLAQELGTNVVVENRPGANAMIAGQAVVNAAPDGQTLFFGASPTITISPNVMKKMPFDPAKDLRAISPILSYDNALVINNDLPFRTVADLIAHARANPGKLSYGSAGIGGSNHLSGELFAAQSGTKLNHVPYKGNAPAMTDVMGGQLTMMFDIVATARQHVSGGRVRALAVTSSRRNPSLPDVPTMREAGLPDYDVTGWFGLYGPARLPDDLTKRLGDALQRTLQNPEVRKALVDRGYEPWIGPPIELVERAAKERAMWAGVTKDIQID